jgi:hypothetical protein
MFLLNMLEARGIDKDLAFEVLNLIVPNEDLYELEGHSYDAAQ